MKRRQPLDTARERYRLVQLYRKTGRYLFEMLLDEGPLGGFRRRMQQFLFSPPQPVVKLSTPVKVRLMIEELGPTFIKIGQIVSSRSDTLPEEWQRELNRLQSNVPPFPSEQVRQTIVEDLGAPPEELFATFEPTPFAAASTAQVHHATLHDGIDVVVKVQRPGIREQMRADLGIMDNAMRVIERRVETVRDIDLRGMLREFGANAIRELDYRGEAYNAYRLGENLKSVEGIKVAVVYPQFSSSRVLTQELVRGVKISDLAAIEAAGLDKEALAMAKLRGAVKQLMIDGFFHGDPHPGNILVNLETGELCYIDLGMVGRLTMGQRVNVVRLLYAIQERNPRSLAQVMRSLSVETRPVNSEAYLVDFERTVAQHWMPGMYPHFGMMMGEVLGVMQEHGLRLDSQLTLGLKFLIQLDAIALRLFPEGELAQLAIGVLREQMGGAITPDTVGQYLMNRAGEVAVEVARRLPSVEDAILSWVDQFQSGRFTLTLDTTQLDETAERLRGFGKYIILGLVLAGMVIGSAIAIQVPALPGSLGQFAPYLGVVGYIVAMLLGAYMVVRLLWQPGDRD